MIRIENLVVEQQNKIFGEHDGGLKYGSDYSKLKSIIRHHKDKSLVNVLVEDLEDNTLRAKVKEWMAGAV